MKGRRKKRVGIVSVGKYMPHAVLANSDLVEIVDTSDEWIIERTGIRERRVVANGERQSDLAERASREALARVGWSPQDLDMIIVGTVTPDHLFPSSANTLAGKLGAIGTPSFDVLAACSGFLYALYQGMTVIESGRAKRVLVVGCDVMTSITNWDDRATCVLFGDGAGAILLEEVDEPLGIVDIVIGSDGRYFDLLNMPAGGSACPATHETVDKRMHKLHMQGKETYKLAVRIMEEVSTQLMDSCHVKSRDLACFIGHQANLRIIEAVTKRLGLKPEQVHNNIERYGNTTSATIPTCLYEAEMERKIKKGDWVLLVTFGAGLTWGGALMRWAADPLPILEEAAVADAVAGSYPEKLRPGRDWLKL